MPLSVSTSGNVFAKTQERLKRMQKVQIQTILERYGQRGVDALKNATPEDTGDTSRMWTYKVTHENGQYKIAWINTNQVNGVYIAILIQYGHATREGGHVTSRPFVNQAIGPIISEMKAEINREVFGR